MKTEKAAGNRLQKSLCLKGQVEWMTRMSDKVGKQKCNHNALFKHKSGTIK